MDDRSGIHSMNDFKDAWSSNRNVRYTTDPNLAMGAIEGTARDCELRLRGEAYDLGPTVPRGDAPPIMGAVGVGFSQSLNPTYGHRSSTGGIPKKVAIWHPDTGTNV